MKEIGSIFPLYERTASPPALPRREGGEAAFLSFCREAIYLIASKELSHGQKVMLPNTPAIRL